MNEPDSLMVELWYEQEPQLDREAVRAAVPGAELADELIVHPGFVRRYVEGDQVAIGTVLTVPTGTPDDAHVPTTRQTWDWEEADAVLARCPNSLLVAELLDRVHPHRDRIDAFLPTLRAVVDQTSPAAIWCANSQRVVRPTGVNELAVFTNVRMFRVEEDGSLVMDTLGLHAFALPDLQCHFSDRDPLEIAGMLFDLAGYLLERGDVIADGDTIGEEPWRARYARSAVDPEREMITLTPA